LWLYDTRQGRGNVGLFHEIPWGRNRELFFLIREFQKGIREFSDPYRETHLGGAALRSPRFVCDEGFEGRSYFARA
jgi:hypothetical protein